ncbi:hypothetical protein [Chitinophaga rhizophila]|nr:hypothetical protein [Chitinophaga rhizophila]
MAEEKAGITYAVYYTNKQSTPSTGFPANGSIDPYIPEDSQ